MWILAVLFAQAAADTPLGAVETDTPTIAAADFAPLYDRDLIGALTYKDYGTGKPVSIPAAVKITPAGENALRFAFAYPDEPTHNGEDIIEISDGGRWFGSEEVIARIASPDGDLSIITRGYGPDDDVESEFRFIYSIDACAYSVIKNVRPLAEEAFFERNRYAVRDPLCN